MPFRRFFERGSQPSSSAESTDAGAPDVEEEAPADSEDDEFYGDIPEDAPRIDWGARAMAAIPGGASTGSKRPATFYGDANSAGPTHITRATGCRVMDTDGNLYIDCTMALGAVALGYAEGDITRAVVEAASAGNVGALPDIREVDLAERLCEVIPCAEQVQFLKTGAEAIAAAVRIARTYTGRSHVVGCGYFGWLDWSATAAGVPQGVRSDFTAVPFDDIGALENAVESAGDTLAAIVIEPVIERLPSEEWIQRARSLCDENGAVLVFDEVKTGFRLRIGGYQELVGITPDLAAFGKAMSNGYPLSAVVGSRDLMDASRRTWISSTLAGESTALAAAGAVLDWHERAEICESLWTTGREMRDGVAAAIAASGISGVQVDGIDPMWLMRFDDPRRFTRFQELGVENGVIFKRGAYNFAAVAHDDEAIRVIEAAASAAFVQLRDEDAQ